MYDKKRYIVTFQTGYDIDPHFDEMYYEIEAEDEIDAMNIVQDALSSFGDISVTDVVAIEEDTL